MDQLPTGAPAPLPGNAGVRTGLRRRAEVMSALAVLLIVVLAATVFTSAQRYRRDQKWTVHSYQVRELTLQLVNHTHVAEIEARSYGLTGNAPSFRQYWQAINAAGADSAALLALVADNPQQTAGHGNCRPPSPSAARNSRKSLPTIKPTAQTLPMLTYWRCWPSHSTRYATLPPRCWRANRSC